MTNRHRAQTIPQILNAVLVATLCVFFASPTAQAAPSESAFNELVSKTLDATVRIETARDRSSGVIISNAGHVLTVAHGLSSDATDIRVLHAGRQYSAAILKHDADRDLAVLQLIQTPETLPTLMLTARNADRLLQVGDMLLATGCPARESNSAGPVVRMGTLKAVTSKFLRSDCSLTAGDSGGPIVCGDGSLVGVNARIGVGKESNLHIPTSSIRSFLAGIPGLKLNVSLDSQSIPPLSDRNEAVRQLSKLQVKIIADEGSLICFGCRIDDSILVTKLSLIEGVPFQVRSENVNVECEIIVSNRELDLAVLKTAASSGSSSFDVIGNIRTSKVQAGDLVYSNVGKRGVIARTDYAEPTARPTLGCTLEMDNQRGLLVEQVAENSAASDAKLQRGDRLLVFCGKPCQELDDIGETIGHLQPGDVVTFEMSRNKTQIEGYGRLRHRPEELLNRTEYLDGRSGSLSHRRTGFAKAIQHDAAIGPDEVGGPLLDSEGRLAGVNIARRARESVLAIPISAVLELIDNARSSE